MIRLAVLASLLAAPAAAERLDVPGLSPVTPTVETCENVPYSKENCVRVLACVGLEGDWFDGRARGWDVDSVAGTLHGPVGRTACDGTWDSRGPGGAGVSSLTCDGGMSLDVVYTSQDQVTGTVIGAGRASDGRDVRVWSGLNVLAFLTPDGRVGAELPCGSEPIPIS